MKNLTFKGNYYKWQTPRVPDLATEESVMLYEDAYL